MIKYNKYFDDRTMYHISLNEASNIKYKKWRILIMVPMEIDGNLLKLIITNGSIKLKNEHQKINDLNVFPVPDGDTGSNMQATMMSGVNAIQPLDNEPVEKVGKALSRGLLMGARGNSGVILSQLFSGFAKAFATLTTSDTPTFIEGLKQGVKQAYSAVINPVEGTILTVAREAAEKAEIYAKDHGDLLEVLDVYLDEAKASLERTPDLLPVLKESGVVDSGGAGLIVIIEGMIAALRGEVYEEETIKHKSTRAHNIQVEQEFGYCTEFIIQLDSKKKFSKDKITKQLTRLGDSIVVVADEEICKVHVHTTKPGDALNIGQNYGEFANLKIENMTLQHTETLLNSVPDGGEGHICGHDHGPDVYTNEVKKKYGLITVVTGQGLKDVFKEMGVDYIIDGGQTMNPSTQDFMDAIERVNADNILIIPNNKNVMLSAEHAAKHVDDKNVIVLPAKTIAQGYASLTMFDTNQDLEATISEMKELIEHVKTGEITHAVRDTEINGIKINKDDYLSIQDGKIIDAKAKRLEAVESLINALVDEDSEIVTIMTGKETEKREIYKVRKYVEHNHGHVEVEIIDGQQEIYDYLIAVE